MTVLSEPEWDPGGVGLKGVEQFAEWLGIDERELEHYESESKPKKKGVVGGGLPFRFRVLISAKTGVRSRELVEELAWNSKIDVQLFTRKGAPFTAEEFRRHLEGGRRFKASLRAERRGAHRRWRTAVKADAALLNEAVSRLLWLAADDPRDIYDLAVVSIHEAIKDVEIGLSLEKQRRSLNRVRL